MNSSGKVERLSLWVVLSLGTALVLRFATIGRLALTDNTESRYATIGWEMFRTGDWITPRIYIKGALIPFWGKPPLQFWLTAASYQLFGVGEAAARIPSVILAVVIVGLTAMLGRRLWGAKVAALAALMLASSGLFFVLAGACVLDVPLAASVTGALASFALFARAPERRGWGLAFLVSLGVGALAKGPIALVLVSLTLFLWLAVARRWGLVLQLPWGLGIPSFLVVAVPWYALAERATPGFLRYFLVNEHILRYVSHNYGDLYGSGRLQPYGASWLMLAVAFLPWTVLAGVSTARLLWGRRWKQSFKGDPWLAFVLIWGLTPALFFTMAKQMLVTYLLPGLPGLALIAAVGIAHWAESERAEGLVRLLRWHLILMAVLIAGGGVAGAAVGVLSMPVAVGACLVAGLAFFVGGRRLRAGDVVGGAGVVAVSAALLLAGVTYALGPRIDEQYSAKTILAAAFRASPGRDRQVVMPYGDEHSAIFYTEASVGRRMEHHGKEGEEFLLRRLSSGGNDLFLFKQKQWRRLAQTTRERVHVVARTPHWVMGEALRDPSPGP